MYLGKPRRTVIAPGTTEEIMRHVSRPSPGMVIALVALILSATGAATAATYVITDSSQVKNGAITGSDISDRSISGQDIKNATITKRDLANGAVTRNRLSARAVALLRRGTIDARGSYRGPSIVSATTPPGASVPLAGLNFVHHRDRVQVDFLGLTVASPASCHPAGGALIIHLVANVASYGPYDVGQTIVPYPGTRMTFSPTLSFLVPVPQTATVDGLELRIWDTCESDSRWSVSSADLVVVSLN